MKDNYTTNSHYLTYCSLKDLENVLFERGCQTVHVAFVSSFFFQIRTAFQPRLYQDSPQSRGRRFRSVQRRRRCTPFPSWWRPRTVQATRWSSHWVMGNGNWWFVWTVGTSLQTFSWYGINISRHHLRRMISTVWIEPLKAESRMCGYSPDFFKLIKLGPILLNLDIVTKFDVLFTWP